MSNGTDLAGANDKRNFLWVLLPALGSIVLAAAGLFEGVAKLGNILGIPSKPFAYISALALCLVSLQFLRTYRRANSSRLRHPERMREFLKPTSPRDLVGRENAIQDLKDDCDRRGVVFLFAPSGTGKTTLIRFGLVPKLDEAGALLPVYVASLGLDWGESEAQRVVVAVREAMQARSLPLEVSQLPVLDDLVSCLPRPPLFIFDQIDHYIARHQARLVSGSAQRVATAGTKRWMNSDQLEASNPFWRSIGALVRRGQARVLFACENEFASVIDPFRFAEPSTINLERLPETAAQELLLRLERDPNGPIIDAPDNGWLELRAQLVNDVSEHSLVVPMQLRVALERLPTLSALTTTAYFDRGGMSGLVGGYVTEQISAASEKASVSLDEAVQLMRAFLDKGSRRAISWTEEELSRSLSMSGMKLKAVLNELSRPGGLLRSAPDAGSGDILYRLRHDYLIQPVVEALRQLIHDGELLSSAHRSFRNSGWLGKWTSLLSFRNVLRLLRARHRRKVLFRGHRVYVALSIARALLVGLLPVIAYVILVDANVALPGGELVRSWLDRAGISVARRPADSAEIASRAKALRDTLGNKILTRRATAHPGWIFGLEQVFVDPDPWTHSQALTGLLEGFDGPIQPGFEVLKALPVVLVGGKAYGFKVGEAPVAVEAVAWAALARLANVRRPTGKLESAGDSAARVRELWLMVENYRRDGANGGQGYAHYPPDASQYGLENGTDSPASPGMPAAVRPPGLDSEGTPSVHGSTLALAILLEAQDLGIDLPNSRERIRALLRFFATERIAPHTGLWRQGDIDCQPCEGLSFQIQSTVLNGVLTGALSAKDELVISILAGIPNELSLLARMPSSYPLCSGRTAGVSAGKPVGTSLYFLWFAWGLSLAARYLECATNSQDVLGELAARRALTHLVMDLGEAEVERHKSEYTYRQAETLLGLAHVERALRTIGE